jgi:hypothetical protein
MVVMVPKTLIPHEIIPSNKSEYQYLIADLFGLKFRTQVERGISPLTSEGGGEKPSANIRKGRGEGGLFKRGKHIAPFIVT